MRHDRTAFVVGAEVAVRDDGTTATRYTLRCPYCRRRHWLWRIAAHVPAPCIGFAGYFIDPIPALRNRHEPNDQRPQADTAAARRAAYIEACRAADTDLGESFADPSMAERD